MFQKSRPILGILLVVGIIALLLFASTKISLWIGIKDGQFIILTALLILLGCFFAFGWIQSSIEKNKKNKEELPSPSKSQSKNKLTTREKFEEIWNILQGGFILLCILIICFFFLKSCIND